MDITQKLWSFCHKLRHDGVDASDYIEQLTYLLFLKMADEKQLSVPVAYNWKELISKSNDELISQLDATLQALKGEKGILGQIFAEPVSRIKNAGILKDLIKEIDNIAWTKLNADVVGLAFEELIGRVANEGKKGAGQYFTPRPLIKAMVNVMQPNPFATDTYKIADVACGTSGFLTMASEYIAQHHSKALTKPENQSRFAKQTFFGQELVQRPRRLALMNLFLHNIDASETVKFGDSIENDQMPNDLDLVLANPPFGNKGAAPVNRKFPVKTSDKQLNFLQLIIEKLKKGGKAAVVLPDSCLTDDKAKELWKYYLEQEEIINLHTILKLPRGTFAAYANGIKACVLFFEKGKKTEKVWVYDKRTNIQNMTKKTRQLTVEMFEDFEKCFAERTETERFKPFSFKQIQENYFALDFKWLQDDVLLDSDELQPPKDLINYALDNLQEAMTNLSEILELLDRK